MQERGNVCSFYVFLKFLPKGPKSSALLYVAVNFVILIAIAMFYSKLFK